MADTITRLNSALEGRYQIEELIGEGGMASVYLAEDLKHKRKVAVKILRPELAAVLGSERFLAEITTTANLQHPNILALFDSGETDGFVYYVMPYVEGETLRTRIDRERQLGIEESVRIAQEVADALHYAHRQGVIHRDIKPENILLHDGRPVVADFGIALAVSQAAGGRMTETGLSLGTPHYMSPEQASADRDLSARSDIYSLGCVLHEMIAGETPHTGPTVQSILVRILTDVPPPLTERRHTVPPYVAAVVQKAIEKLPADRFETAKDFRDALADPSFTYAPALARTGVAARGALARAQRAGLLAWLGDLRSRVAVAAVLAAGLGWLFSALGRRPEVDTARIPYRFVALDPSPRAYPEVGADGSVWIAEAREDSSGTFMRLRVRRPGATGFVDVGWVRRHEEQVQPPAFMFSISPDATSLAYFEARAEGNGTDIVSFAPATGERRVLATLPDFRHGFINDWAADGYVYGSALTLTPSGATPVNLRVPAAGGPLDTIPIPYAPERFAAVFKKLPGGDAVLYTETSDQGARIMAYRLGSGDTVDVTEGALPVWSPTGHVIVGRSGFLYAVPFDPSTLRATGPPVQLLAGMEARDDISLFDLSASGTLAFIEGPTTQDQGVELVFEWMGANGNVEPIALPPFDHADAAVSPDGTKIAYTREEQLWIHELVSGGDRTLGRSVDWTEMHDPVWSPDGRRILFSAAREGSGGDLDLYVQDVNPGGESLAQRVGGTTGRDFPLDWADDGTVVFQAFLPRRFAPGRQWDVYRLTIGEEDSEVALLEAEYDELNPYLSPDGRWLAYLTDQDSTSELYVRRYPSMAAPQRISTDLGNSAGAATWSPDGQSVRYVARDSLFTARLDLSGDAARVVSRRAEIALPADAEVFDYDAVSDRFLLVRNLGGGDTEDTPPARRLIVIVNWLDELRARVASR